MPDTLTHFVAKSIDNPTLRKVADYLPVQEANVGKTERLLSAALGGFLTLHGLMGRKFDLLSTLVGGALLYRGASGHCQLYQALGVNTADDHGPATVIEAGAGVRVEHAVTIEKSAAELYRYWRKLENLPRFMIHIEEVRETGANRSHWVAKGPLSMTVEWEAEITNDVPNQTIAWKSRPGSDIDTAGSVHFREVTGTSSTEVRVNLKYDPPAGKLGHAVAWFFGKHPEQQIQEDLARFKTMMEATKTKKNGK